MVHEPSTNSKRSISSWNLIRCLWKWTMRHAFIAQAIRIRERKGYIIMLIWSKSMLAKHKYKNPWKVKIYKIAITIYISISEIDRIGGSSYCIKDTRRYIKGMSLLLGIYVVADPPKQKCKPISTCTASIWNSGMGVYKLQKQLWVLGSW